MKKAYIAYCVVMCILCAVGLRFLAKAVNRVQTDAAALEEGIADVETAISSVEAQVAQPAVPAEAPKPAAEAPKQEAKAAERVPETPVTGLAPSCADPGDLKQAVNPTPRGIPYKGQLRLAYSGRGFLRPCTVARAFSNTGESSSIGTLPFGKYQLPYGTLTVHGR